MKTITPDKLHRWLLVTLFALAFAWVESAVVFYLRTHIDRIVPYQTYPLPIIGGFGPIEFAREFATMVMIFTVGALAGTTWRTRWGYAMLAFGVWDIFYYVFLKIMCGWPKSLFDWDILFLIPLPWWGPVLAPAAIALLMVAWGTLVTQFEQSRSRMLSNLHVWSSASIGATLALYVFMADALRVRHQGLGALRNLLPEEFNWPLFLVALALLSAPVVQELVNRTPRVSRVANAGADEHFQST